VSDGNVTIRRKVHFSLKNKGRREIRPGPAPVPQRTPKGSIPRISRLTALAIRFENLISSGAVADQADLARLGHVTRARVTQIMNLLLLAPDIQEDILFLPRTLRWRDPIVERHLRPLTLQLNWTAQRAMWKRLKRERY